MKTNTVAWNPIEARLIILLCCYNVNVTHMAKKFKFLKKFSNRRIILLLQTKMASKDKTIFNYS